MSKFNEKLALLFKELRRRKTFQAAAAYVVFAWLLIEVSSTVLPAFSAPEWILPSLIVALAVGLPIAMIISWIFDVSFSGVERTESLDDIKTASDTAITQAVVQAVKPSVAVPLGKARLRQVTLLRCTFELLKDGKNVNDPESLMALRETFDELIYDLIARFTGVMIGSAGTSYEILFGYPTAFENDALRASAAAFSLNHSLRAVKPAHRNAAVVASIGIHSDAVVIEKTDDDDTIRVVGDVSQVSAWLQTLAKPGSITLSEDVHSLLRDKVRAESLGRQRNLRTGIETTVYRADALMPHDSVASSRATNRQTMIGRDAELAMLLDRWELAKDREDQFILLRGEPGIGKSTLVSGFTSRVQQDDGVHLVTLFCSPFESNSAFYPILEYFLGPVSGSADESAHEGQQERISTLLDQAGLDSSDAEALRSELLAVATNGGKKREGGKTAEEARRDLLRSLLEYFSAAARQGHVLIIVEDIQWADPSTMEIIDMLMSGGTGLGVFSLFTARADSEFDWTARPNVLVLDLQRLPKRAIENLIREVAGDLDLSDEMLSKILAETDGNPLFAEELTRAITEQGAENADELVLPGTVQQSLESRMDKLGDAQPLLQLCSLLGASFDYELLLAVSETENEKALQSDLRSIVNTGLLYQEGAVPNSTYRFKHMLMQETAHGTLLKATRIQQHAKIAEIIGSRFPEKGQRQPALLAYHYSEGAAPDKAMPFWIQACRKSLQAHAIREALDQADSGLEVLQHLPDGDQRDGLEVILLSVRGKCLIALRGYGDPLVEATFARALTLTESVDDSPQLFQLVVGLWMYFFIAGEAEHALALARRLQRIADEAGAPAKSLQAHYCLGYAMFRLGRYSEALAEYEQALAVENEDADFASESASGDDTRVHLRVVLSHVLWHLGDDERSLAMSKESRELAHELGNPFGIVFAEFMSCWLYMLRRDPANCARHAGHAIKVAEERSFHFWLPLARFMQTWATCDGGHEGDNAELTERIDLMESSLLKYVRAGATNGEISLSLQIAEDSIRIDRLDSAVEWLKRAEKCMEATGERFLAPEATRVRALIDACRGKLSEAEEGLAEAQSGAREMGSVSLARRAASDLAALQEKDQMLANGDADGRRPAGPRSPESPSDRA